MQEPLLQCTDVHISYNDFEVVSQFNFTLNEGEIKAIFGESGSGKSTILKAFKGLLDVSKGSVSFLGEEVWGPSDTLVPGVKRMEIVYQDFQLEEGLTLFNNVRHHLIHLKREDQIRITHELMDLCGLKDLKEKFPKHISGGQKQKVALAKALISEPKLLLLDEPFSHLDFIAKEEFKEIVKNICKKLKIAVVFVTHNALDAISFSDELILLKNGKIIQRNAPNNIVTSPKNEYVARLLGYENILLGKTINQLFSTNEINNQLFVVPQNALLKNGNQEFKIIEHAPHPQANKLVLLKDNIELVKYTHSEPSNAGYMRLKIDTSKLIPIEA